MTLTEILFLSLAIGGAVTTVIAIIGYSIAYLYISKQKPHKEEGATDILRESSNPDLFI